MNAGYRWNASACAFTTSFTDNILTESHDNAGGKQEAFRIVSDEELRPQLRCQRHALHKFSPGAHAQEGHGA